MHELVDLLYILNHIPRYIPHDVAEIVLVQFRPGRYPEAHVLRAGGVLRVGLERRELTLLELAQEAWILRPEQADVGDGEENHGDALEPEAPAPFHCAWGDS